MNLLRPNPLKPDLGYLIHLQRPAAVLKLREGYPRAQLAGAHLSKFQGRGIEFDEVRLYQAGDDVRNIDWRVTARTGKPHTKLYCEERERPVMLMLDLRPAMFFATRGALKAVVATECASLLGWSILHQGDRIGCMIFDGTQSNQLPPLRPARGKRAVMRMLGEVIAHPSWQQPPSSQPGSLLQALQRVAHLSQSGSLILVVSDGRGLDADCESRLMRLLHHHSIVFVQVYDAFERELEDAGLLYVSDGQEVRVIDSHQRQLRQQHAARFDQRREILKRLDTRPGFVFVECATDETPLFALQRRLGGSP